MTTVQAAYRDDTAAATLRYEEQAARWTSDAALLTSAAEVHARRSSRIAAGTTGIVGFFAIIVGGLVSALVFRRLLPGVMTLILFASWGAMGIAHVVARRRAVARAARVALAPAPTGDPWADLACLAALPPGARIHALAASQERASASLPLVALSLLAPLSIHGVLFTIGALVTRSLEGLGRFDGWIVFYLLVVGHAHFGLAWSARTFAKDLASIPDDQLRHEADRSGYEAFKSTVLISALPGALLLLLPPILTAVTGFLFCGPMFRWMGARVRDERDELGAAPQV